MESFHWDKHFLTGFEDVDQQHHSLVNMINQFSSLLAEDEIHLEDIDHLFTELADYSIYHFQEEEKLMVDSHVDTRHIDKHIQIHKQFLEDVTSIYSTITTNNLSKANALLEYLMHWLAYHILGQDQDMAKQIKSIQSGVKPENAYDNIEQERVSATAPLLNALNGLFDLLTVRNDELKELNNSLEDKVALRTEELAKVNNHLKELSLTDVLTGLANRRHAIWYLSTLWDESVENDTPLTCLMIDADHFKEVNDTYGHNAGDLVLIELAKTLQYNLRTDDRISRIGGDEFLVICPDTDKTDGLRIAELIRETVSNLQVQTGGEPWKGSISVGVASRSTHTKTYKELLKESDKALYAAKDAGKNCVQSLN